MIKGKAKLEFGIGDIRMTSSYSNGIGAVVLITQDPHEIGEVVPISADWSPSEAEVILTFTKIESIDVLICKLEEVKNCMVGNAPSNWKISDGPQFNFDEFLDS